MDNKIDSPTCVLCLIDELLMLGINRNNQEFVSHQSSDQIPSDVSCSCLYVVMCVWI